MQPKNASFRREHFFEFSINSLVKGQFLFFDRVLVNWTIEEAKKIMEQKKLRCDPYEFAAILNAMYSDYCSVMRKHDVESDDLYADLAAEWLIDDDAMPNKAMLYYECIVEK